MVQLAYWDGSKAAVRAGIQLLCWLVIHLVYFAGGTAVVLVHMNRYFSELVVLLLCVLMTQLVG